MKDTNEQQDRRMLLRKKLGEGLSRFFAEHPTIGVDLADTDDLGAVFLSYVKGQAAIRDVHEAFQSWKVRQVEPRALF